MDFYELKAFVVLSQKLHFAHAAEDLNLSPSALSRLILRLEEECKAVFFDRNNREVSLTEEGKKFLVFAQECLERREILLEKLHSHPDRITGILKVYASVTACYTIMPPFIKRLSAEYPGIHLAVETGDPAGAISAVKDGRAHLAVAAIPETNIFGFDCYSVTRSPLVFAASRNSAYTSISGSPQDILSSVPLILPKAGIARERFDIWTKSRNVIPHIAAEAEGNEAIMALTELGIGIGLVPKIVLENGPYTEGFVCHEAGNTLGYYNIGFIQKKNVAASEKHNMLRNAVTKIVTDITKEH